MNLVCQLCKLSNDKFITTVWQTFIPVYLNVAVSVLYNLKSIYFVLLLIVLQRKIWLPGRMESQRRCSTQPKAITMAPIIKSSITSYTERRAVCFQQGVYRYQYNISIMHVTAACTHTVLVVSYLSRVHYSIKN